MHDARGVVHVRKMSDLCYLGLVVCSLLAYHANLTIILDCLLVAQKPLFYELYISSIAPGLHAMPYLASGWWHLHWSLARAGAAIQGLAACA